MTKQTIGRIVASTILTATIATVNAQSAIDALQVTKRDFKGTARFMSMGGAFTALGGDLSAISINPAGIGVYRSSEIGATLDINMQSSEGTSPTDILSESQTRAYCNNFGYVGTVRLNSALQTFSWGITYNRQASFDRLMSGYALPVNTSLTNYIAAFTNGVNAADMEFWDNDPYNPYFDSDIDWLSILGYNSFLINNPNGSSDEYIGLFTKGTVSDADMTVHEKGYVDNYEFTFGGNVSDLVYWGVGIGINDLHYERHVYYSESMNGAQVYSDRAAGTSEGVAEYSLLNDKIINGTGWNLSFGLIVKPIQELRFGASIISPTWYNLDETYTADCNYYSQAVNEAPVEGTELSPESLFSWKLRSPWRFNVGAAAVLGSKAIVSFDYELQAYSDMNVQAATYDRWGYVNGYVNYDYVNDGLKKYTQNGNNIRIGAEYRITPKLSARLGYNLMMSNINKETRDGMNEILTAGTDASYELDKDTNHISVGLGYRFGNFYADATYMHTSATSTMHPYTSYGNVDAPYFDITENNNSIILSVGYKF